MQTPRQEQLVQVRQVKRKYHFLSCKQQPQKAISFPPRKMIFHLQLTLFVKINDACQNKIEFLRASLRYHDLQVEPGQPGSKVSKKINYKRKKEFAFRMRKREPTAAMPKPSFLSEQAFSRSIVVMSFHTLIIQGPAYCVAHRWRPKAAQPTTDSRDMHARGRTADPDRPQRVPVPAFPKLK